MRIIENYCSTDPCDPESLEPENIKETAKACEELDISQIWNDRHQTQESHFLHDIQTGLARLVQEKLYQKLEN